MFSMSRVKQYLLRCTPESMWPYKKVYCETEKLIKNIESWDKEKIKKWQFNELKKLINFTWENSEGYRTHWIANDFKPSDLCSLTDIHKIPFITKDIIQNNLDLFSTKGSRDRYKVSTGGSTGVPLSFYNSKKFRTIEDCFINSIWSQFYPSMKRKTARTILRGGVIAGNLKYDPLFGLRLSSRDVTPDIVHKFILAIDEFKTPIFHVYPSSLYVVAKLMLSNGIDRPKHKFKMICFGSEPLYNFQIDTINKVFDEPRCFWYGSTEKVVLAGNCSGNDNFHIYPQYGVTEIIKTDNKVATEGEVGEIVGTSFWGLDTPFIRYKSGDMARVGGESCESCGRDYQLLESVEGRIQEFVVGNNNALLSMTYINAHDDIFDSIKQFRFKQEHIGIVEFLFVRKEDKIPFLDDISERLKVSFGPNYTIILKEVDEILLTSSGKMSFLEQSLDIKKYL